MPIHVQVTGGGSDFKKEHVPAGVRGPAMLVNFEARRIKSNYPDQEGRADGTALRFIWTFELPSKREPGKVFTLEGITSSAWYKPAAGGKRAKSWDWACAILGFEILDPATFDFESLYGIPVNLVLEDSVPTPGQEVYSIVRGLVGMNAEEV